MGVYIKGMKLPKCCFECPCYHRRRDVGYYDYELCDASGTIFNDSYSSVTGHKDRSNPFEERLSNCPLIEIPAHGDLIDVDVLMQHEVLLPMDGGNMPIVYSSYIRNAPTIVEAEG